MDTILTFTSNFTTNWIHCPLKNNCYRTGKMNSPATTLSHDKLTIWLVVYSQNPGRNSLSICPIDTPIVAYPTLGNSEPLYI